MSQIEPFKGDPHFPLCDDLGEALCLRSIRYVSGAEPQLFLSEVCVKKTMPIEIREHAQGLSNDPVFRAHLEEALGKARGRM